jgi:hypothetical protein
VNVRYQLLQIVFLGNNFSYAEAEREDHGLRLDQMKKTLSPKTNQVW